MIHSCYRKETKWIKGELKATFVIGKKEIESRDGIE